MQKLLRSLLAISVCPLSALSVFAQRTISYDPHALSLAEQYLFRSVNAERAAVGLRPVQWNARVENAARFHAQNMGSANTLSHQLSGEPDLTARVAAAGARFRRVTENVAVGQSILQIHEALMRSPHHRENILDGAVDLVGISVMMRNGELWAVEDFASGVENLSYSEQEKRVASLLQTRGIPTEPTEDARATCRLETGYVGERPAFVMRYTTGDLNRLPEQLAVRLNERQFSQAAVGACAQQANSGFSSFNVAVVLYR